MVLFWCRMKQAQLRALSSQFRRCYFQIHGPSLVIRETRIGAVTSPNLAIHKTGSELGNYVRFYAAPVQVNTKYEEKDNDKDKGRPRMNEQISAQYVRLVTDEGHGVVSRHEALDRARRLNVDLVEVQADAKPPVCKLMDYNKEMFARQAKEKELSKKKSAVTLRKGSMKEVRITCKIDGHDLQTKADGVRRLTENGHRVKCMAVAVAPPSSSTPEEKIRNLKSQDLGGLITRFAALVDDFSLVESGPRVELKQAYIVVRHVKFGPLKKGPGKKKIAAAISNKKMDQNQNLDESDSEEPFEIESPPETSNINTTVSENRYAATRPPNGSENRYATTRPTTGSGLGPDNQYAATNGSGPGPGNRYAATRPTNGSDPGPDNRYAATNASGPGPGNRYAATRPTNGSDPGTRRRFEPESQNPDTRRFEPESQNPGTRRRFEPESQNPGTRRRFEPESQNPGDSRQFGQTEPNNRYKKGPTPPSDYNVNRGGRGDFSRENGNLNPGGIRDRDGFRR